VTASDGGQYLQYRQNKNTISSNGGQFQGHHLVALKLGKAIGYGSVSIRGQVRNADASKADRAR